MKKLFYAFLLTGLVLAGNSAMSQAITLNVQLTNLNCFQSHDGAIDLTASGGDGIFTFAWSGPNGFSSTVEDITNLEIGDYAVLVTDGLGATATSSWTITEPASISITLDLLTNVVCPGGTNGAVSITVTGGVTSYTFNWNDGSNSEDRIDLAAGTYNMTVTDAKTCSATASYTITDPADFALAPVVTDVLCHGNTNGAINLTVTGGMPTYAFLWSNDSTTEDITGLAAGSYQITITDALSCQFSQSFTVTEPDILIITGTPVDPSCFQFSNGSITTNTVGGTSLYTWLWNDGPTSADRSGLPAGNYTVTVSDAHGCTDTEPFTLVDPAPVTGAINPPTQALVCSGNDILPINFTADNYTPQKTSVSWTRDHSEITGSISLSGNGTIVGFLDNKTASSVTVTFTVTPSAIGCQGPDVTATVVVPPALLDSIKLVSSILCAGDSATLMVYAYNGTPPYTGDSIYKLAAGKHFITVTDAIGCTHLDTVVILEPTPLVVDYISNNATCIIGSDGSILVSLSGGTPPYTWAWSDGYIDQNRFGLEVGSYTLTVTDNNLCTVIKEVVIGYNFISPIAKISAPPTVCTGYALPLTVNFTGTPPFTFTYTNGYQLFTISDILDLTYTFNVFPYANTMYFLLSVQDAHCPNGIITGLPAVVIVKPLPTAAMLPPAAICAGDTATITVNLTGTPPWSFAWNDGTDHIVTNILESPYEIKVAPAFNQYYQIAYVGDDNCYGTDLGQPVTVIVHSRPTATLNGNSYTRCVGIAANLPVYMTGVSPWTLSYTDGTTVTTISGLTNQQYNIVAIPGQSTTYSLVSIQDNFCSGTVAGQVDVIINPRPVADWTGSLDTICTGSTGTFSINLSGTPPWNLSWFDIGPHSATNIMSSPFTFTANPAYSTTFMVTALSDANCEAIVLGQTHIVFVDQTPTAIISSRTPMCSSTGGDLKVNLTGISPWRLTWQEDNIVHVDSNILFTPYYIHVTPIDSATFWLVTVEDAYCSGTVDQAFFKVDVFPTPVATMSGITAEMSLCQGSPFNVIPDFQSGAPSYTLLFQDNQMNNLTITNMHQGDTATIYPPAFPGIYNYQLVSLTDSNGCFIIYNTDFAVTVLSRPLVNAGQDTSFYLGDSVTLQGSFTEGTAPFTYNWVPGANLNQSNILDPVSKPNTTTTYSLYVTDSNGCQGVDNVTLTVIVEQAVFGYVTYDNSVHTPLSNVKVVLINNLGTHLDSTMTSSNGYYELTGIPNGNYSLSLSTTRPWMLQNAVDALLIMKSFVAITPLHGLRLRAANVDAIGVGNAIDALLVAKRFTGQLTSFNAGDWIFEDVNFTIPDTNYQYNIKGLCVGDVNGSSIPLAKLGCNLELQQIGELAIETGTTFSIPVKLSKPLTMGAMSLVFKYPSDRMEIEAISMPGSVEAPVYNVVNDEIRIAWYSLTPSEITDENAFLVINARLRPPFTAGAIHFGLSAESQLSNADAQDAGQMNLIIPKLITSGTAFTLETMPNPATNNTRCIYSLSSDASVSLRLLDPLGREIRTLQNGMQTSGSHFLDVDLSNMAQGLYFLRMAVLDNSGTSHSQILKLNVVK